MGGTSLELEPVWLTLRLAALTLAILLALGLPLAWWLSRTRSRARVLVETLTALPLVLPPTVLGFYLLMLLGAQGAVGEGWMALTGRPLAFSFAGLVVASCLYSLPFVVQPLQAAFAGVDPRSIEASMTLGASRWRTYARVVLPQVRRGLLVASVLGFTHTLGEFGVVLMVGGNIPGETQVLSVAIYERVEVLDYAGAHAYSLGLVVFSFAVLSVIYALTGGTRELR
jgi:molybdate transport system permease protein